MEHPLFHLLSFPDELQLSLNPPAQKYVRDSKARASTAMDVKEHPQSYVFVADMPGLKSADIKVNTDAPQVCATYWSAAFTLDSVQGNREHFDVLIL